MANPNGSVTGTPRFVEGAQPLRLGGGEDRSDRGLSHRRPQLRQVVNGRVGDRIGGPDGQQQDLLITTDSGYPGLILQRGQHFGPESEDGSNDQFATGPRSSRFDRLRYINSRVKRL